MEVGKDRRDLQTSTLKAFSPPWGGQTGLRFSPLFSGNLLPAYLLLAGFLFSEEFLYIVFGEQLVDQRINIYEGPGHAPGQRHSGDRNDGRPSMKSNNATILVIQCVIVRSADDV